MTERSSPSQSLLVRDDQPLIGIIVQVDGEELIRYFTDEAAVDAATTEAGIQAALDAIGAWRDLDWQETAAALDQIRHESSPTPPIDEL